MTPDEVAEQWGIGGDDALEMTIKILKTVPGEKEPKLLQSIPLIHYDGEAMAKNFGPGNYYLRPSSGAYASNSAKVPVSEELARSCGFGRLPVTAQDATAERTIRAAAEAPVDPLDLLAAVQQVVRRELDERDRGHHIQPQQGPGNPFQSAETQMEQMMKMWDLMDRMERRAMESAERRLGGVPVDPKPETNASLFETLLPMGLKILDRMTSGPAAQPQVRVPPGYQLVPIQPRAALPSSEPAPSPEDRPVITLTQEEAAAIAQAVAMLKPYAAQLVELAGSQATDDQIAEELAGYIPDRMIPSFTALSSVVGTKGPGVLESIHPGLNHGRWSSIMPKIVAALA